MPRVIFEKSTKADHIWTKLTLFVRNSSQYRSERSNPLYLEKALNFTLGSVELNSLNQKWPSVPGVDTNGWHIQYMIYCGREMAVFYHFCLFYNHNLSSITISKSGTRIRINNWCLDNDSNIRYYDRFSQTVYEEYFKNYTLVLEFGYWCYR